MSFKREASANWRRGVAVAVAMILTAGGAIIAQTSPASADTNSGQTYASCMQYSDPSYCNDNKRRDQAIADTFRGKGDEMARAAAERQQAEQQRAITMGETSRASSNTSTNVKKKAASKKSTKKKAAKKKATQKKAAEARRAAATTSTSRSATTRTAVHTSSNDKKSSDDRKSDAKKSDDKKSDAKKSDDKKSDDKKSDAKKAAGPAPKGNQDSACLAFKAFSSYSFHVNDGAALTTLKNKVHQGDTVTFNFKLKEKCNNVYVGLDSYKAGSAKFKPSIQDLDQRDDGIFKTGKTHTLEVDVPECYFQIDAYTSGTFEPGKYTAGGGKGFLTADLGGSDEKCPAPKPPTVTHKPSVVVTQVCKADASGWKIDFKNEGNVEETFVVKSGAKTLDTVKVPAKKIGTKNYSFADAKVAAGKSITLTITGNNKTLLTKTITNDCTKVAATIAVCLPASDGVPAITDGAILTFRNTGKLTESFKVTRDGAAVEGSPVSVAAGATAQRKLPLKEDEKASIVITSDRSDLRVAKDVVNDCVQPATTTSTTAPTQVMSEQEVRPQLASTGANSTPLVAIGSGLFVLGLALLGFANRGVFRRVFNRA